MVSNPVYVIQHPLLGGVSDPDMMSDVNLRFEPLCNFMVIIFPGVVHNSWSRTCDNDRRNRPAGLVLQVNDCIIIYYILLFTI